jgi:general secretion pathway protein L
MGENNVYGLVVSKKSKTADVEMLIELPTKIVTSDQQVNATKEVFSKLLQEAGQIDEICLVIPATMTVIKELDVPFIDINKIRLVIEYELEPLLPFSLDEALVDFVVIKSNPELQSCQVLAVALRKKDLQALLEPYEQSNINKNSYY